MSGALANQADWTSAAGPHNAMDFVVRRILSELWTATIVRVMACTSAGGLAVAGTVDVLPLVNQIDGAGNATPHGIINGLLYFRAQGGANAIIMDPVVGDLGIAIFASRDISAVRATRAQANPGSFRRFDPADGIYLGGLLNGIPTQYVQFSASGMTLVSPTLITLQAPTITLSGNVGTVGTLMNNGVSVGSTHVHINGGGTGDSGPPVS